MEFVVALLLALLALGLWWAAARARRSSGLPEGRVVYSDTGAWRRNEQALYSDRHGLTGKPDYLVRDGDDVIPVEVKSGRAPRAPREGHVLQLAAYCLLVEEQTGRRPRVGIIKYDDREFELNYSAALEAELLRALAEMRADAAAAAGAPRDHEDARRCAACGVRDACDQRLA